MKPVLENIFHEKEVIKASKYELPYFNYPYHYHPEYEITYIEESEGTMYIGDKKVPFGKGELTFIGPSISHAWVNSKAYYKGDKIASTIVIQFSNDLFPDTMLQAREFYRLKKLLHDSHKCIKFKSLNSKSLTLMNKICKTGEEERYVLLVQLLLNMASMNHENYLMEKYENSKHHSNSRLDKLLTYIYNHFQDINLDKVSENIGMNKSALCRYIKKHTNNTFSELVNKVRIKNACILLRETDLSIIQIAFDTGYTSASYFIRMFRKVIGKAPSEYRDEFS